MDGSLTLRNGTFEQSFRFRMSMMNEQPMVVPAMACWQLRCCGPLRRTGILSLKKSWPGTTLCSTDYELRFKSRSVSGPAAFGGYHGQGLSQGWMPVAVLINKCEGRLRCGLDLGQVTAAKLGFQPFSAEFVSGWRCTR